MMRTIRFGIVSYETLEDVCFLKRFFINLLGKESELQTPDGAWIVLITWKGEYYFKRFGKLK